MLSHCADTQARVCPRPQRGIDAVQPQNHRIGWVGKDPLRVIESDSLWTGSINSGENTAIPAVGQVCFRGVLLPLLRACVGPPGRDNRPDQEKVRAAKPHCLWAAGLEWAGSWETCQGEAALGEHLLIRKPRPWWKMQPEALWDGPITVARPPRWESERVPFWVRRSQTAHNGNCGQSSSAWASKWCQRTRGCSWWHQPPLLLANEWWLPPRPAIGPAVTSPNKVPA